MRSVSASVGDRDSVRFRGPGFIMLLGLSLILCMKDMGVSRNQGPNFWRRPMALIIGNSKERDPSCLETLHDSGSSAFCSPQTPTHD